MTSEPNSPDRRPLVYGGVALLILLAAAYLFWPHGPAEEIPSRMVLTPEAARTDEETSNSGDLAVEDGAETANSLAAGEETAPIETESVDLPDQTMKKAEERIVDATPETPAPAVQKPETSEPRRSTLAHPGAPSTPQADGSYVLNVGAFSTRSNAESRATELKAEGLNAHVHAATKDDGSTFYRVRIGYFPSRSVAEGYGQWLKREHTVDSWASGR